VSSRLEVPPQRDVVVDLAIDNHGALTILGRERLAATGDIDDRQPGVDQQRGAAGVIPLSVRTPVSQRADHGRTGLSRRSHAGIE
jgi:hypothetical protein